MTYDAARGQVVLFGGYRSAHDFGDTWTWDGTDWTQLSPVHSPSARDGMAWPTTPLGARSCCSAAWT